MKSGVHPSCSSRLTVGVTITDLQFGLGIAQNVTIGIIGIGYPGNEALIFQNKTGYPNLIEHMFSQGLVESRSYSLYLNDLDALTGNIIFGGVDLDAFSGTLYTFPLNPPKSGAPIAEFIITLTGITVTSDCGCSSVIGPSSSFPANALLDSGTTVVGLPQAIADNIAAELNATLEASGVYNLPSCDSLPSTGSLTFDFSGATINVPFGGFVLPGPENGTCILGLQVIEGNCVILGDTFLRSAYVVFDLVRPHVF